LIHAHSESYANEINEEETERLLALCREYKREINTNKGVDISSMLIDLGQRLATGKGSE
jgi:hypothetical protein